MAEESPVSSAHTTMDEHEAAELTEVHREPAVPLCLLGLCGHFRAETTLMEPKSIAWPELTERDCAGITRHLVFRS